MRSGRGFTVIVLSYDRPRSLRSLLRGLAAQRLDGLAMELIVCNNAAGVHLSTSPWTATGRLLRGFDDAKIFNSSHNWLCRVRYALAALAAHETIVFLDDDVVIEDDEFLRYMYDSFAKVRPIDVLACWTALWTEWNDECLKKVRMNFDHAEPDVMTECDYAGPGLCIFDRRILTESGLLALPPEFHRSDSTWFPWLTAMKMGTRKYYLPSHGRVRFHAQYKRHELTTSPGFRPDMYGAYKKLWKQGYVPVLERKRADPDFGAITRGARRPYAARRKRRLVVRASAPYIRVTTQDGADRVSGVEQCGLGHRLAATAHGCDGVFASWSFDGNRLVVETDRYGMYPLFVHVTENEIAVSPSIVTLLDLGAPRDLDLDALCVFLHIGFFLREETPFRSIRALPPGGRLEWTRDGFTLRGAAFLTPAVPIARTQAIDAYVDLFRQAMRRRPPRERVALPLSGGRDSRHILWELVADGHAPAACVTARHFPPRPDEDARVAPLVAAAAGAPHVLLEQGDELDAEERKNAATGFCTDEHAWFEVVAEYLGRGFETVYDGIGGDVLSAGLFLTPARLALQAAGSYQELAEVFMAKRNAVTLSRLLAPQVRARLSRERARARVAGELAAHAGAANPIGSFCFWNRTRREIALAPYRMGPATATVYAPYLDHELYDFLASLPASMLVDRSFHTDTIRHAFPQHASIAFERADVETEAARRADRRFMAALLRSPRAQHDGRGVLLAPRLRRRLRLADATDGFRAERNELQPRLALYLSQLEEAASA